MVMRFKKAVLITLVLLSATIGLAHDLFIRAKPFVLEKPGTIVFAMNLAEAFPGVEETWRTQKTAKFWMFGPDGQKELTAVQGKNPEIQFAQEGTYLLAWNATPSYIVIEPKMFNQYIVSEGYKNVVELRTHQGKQETPGREKYLRFLKSFVQVGSARTDNFNQVLGQTIELIPLTNPYSVSPGSELAVKVLFSGKPLSDARVMGTYDSFSKEHDVYAHTVQTNAEGIAQIPIDHSGIWMIRTNHMIPLEENPKADWESYWTNISFFVSPK